MKKTVTIYVRDHDAVKLRDIYLGEEQHKIHIDIEEAVKLLAEQRFPGKHIRVEEYGFHDGSVCHRFEMKTNAG